MAESSIDTRISSEHITTRIEPEQTTSTQQEPHILILANSSTSFAPSQLHRLPKLTLLIFDCDILKRQSFWDTIESAIHLNLDVHRFIYLKSQLECEAVNFIQIYKW